MRQKINTLLLLTLLAVLTAPAFGEATANYYNNRGIAKEGKADSDGAIADYTRAMAINPKAAEPYDSLGCLYYDRQEFTNALADYQQECTLDSTSDYGHYRLWLVRARLGEATAATEALIAFLKHRQPRQAGPPVDWRVQIGWFLTGQLAETEFLKAAGNADTPQTEKGQRCEACFYAGSKRLLAGDKTTAADYFNQCLATGARNFEEYNSAAAELKALAGDAHSQAGQ